MPFLLSCFLSYALVTRLAMAVTADAWRSLAGGAEPEWSNVVSLADERRRRRVA